MTENTKLSAWQKAFIDNANKEIDFIKNVADVKMGKTYDDCSDRIVGIEDNLQNFS